MNPFNKLRVSWELSRYKVAAFLMFVGIFLVVHFLVISSEELLETNQRECTDIANLVNISYEDLLGPPALDSSAPIVNAITINYEYSVGENLFKDSKLIQSSRDIRRFRKAIEKEQIEVCYLWHAPNISRLRIVEK